MDKVTFLPMVPQDTIHDLYQLGDICYFASYHKFGLSRIPLEAMACGCIVITYGNEGSDEIVENEKNGFIVRPGDDHAILEIISRLKHNPDLVSSLTRAARQEIETNNSMGYYLDKIESALSSTCLRIEDYGINPHY